MRCCDVQKELIHDLNFADFFLKHTDMSYNVIKRVISNMIYKSDNNLKVTKEPTGNPDKIILEFYQKIIERLSEQDEKYHFNDDKKFSNRFRKHPVVGLFLDRDFSETGIELKFDTDKHTDDKSATNKPSICICADITV